MNAVTDVWDAIIVGAGPAGSSLAARLGALGRSVLLLDSARFPRGKVCGEYLGPGCLPLFAEIGAADEVLRQAHATSAMRAVSPGGVEFAACYPEGQHALSLRREKLDWILLECARGAKTVEVREGCRVQRLLIEDGTVRGVIARRPDGEVETCRARVTIGADGRNSVVARGLDVFRWHATHRRFSCGLHFEGVDGSRAGAEIYAGRGLYAILNQQGNGVANLSIVAGQARLELWKGRLREGFDSLLGELPRLRERLHGARPLEAVHALGPLAHYATSVSADGALLVGDAAGFYDPFTGEGVYMALVGARLAAEVIDDGIRRGSLSRRVLGRYDGARRAALANRYRLQALIQRVLACPRLADVASRQLAHHPSLTGRLLAYIGGVRPA